MHCTPEQLALAALHEALPADEAPAWTAARAAAHRSRRCSAVSTPSLYRNSLHPARKWPRRPLSGRASRRRPASGCRPRPERTDPDGLVGILNSRPAPTQPEHLPEPRRLRPRNDVPSPRSANAPRLRRRLVLVAVAAAILGAGIALGAITLTHRTGGTPLAATRLQALERSGAWAPRSS